MFGELIQLAIRNLMRARARLMMTSGGVLVGTTAIILLLAMTNGLQRAAEMGIGQNQTLTRFNVAQRYQWNRDGTPSDEEFPQLTMDAIEKFRSIEGVQTVIAVKSLNGGEISTEDGLVTYASIYGVEPEALKHFSITIEQGVAELQPGLN